MWDSHIVSIIIIKQFRRSTQNFRQLIHFSVTGKKHNTMPQPITHCQQFSVHRLIEIPQICCRLIYRQGWFIVTKMELSIVGTWTSSWSLTMEAIVLLIFNRALRYVCVCVLHKMVMFREAQYSSHIIRMKLLLLQRQWEQVRI